MAFTYNKSGVNYSLMDPFKNAALKIGGNSSEIVEFPDFYLIDVLEALGSLNQLAQDLYQKSHQDYFYQVGWGNAATILNDLSMTGANPLTMKFFIAAGDEDWYRDQKRWVKLLQGFGEAAKYAGASWSGGETQTLVDIVNPKSIVLAGSTTGIIQPKSNLLAENKIQANDRIILLSSSGIHTNGITLIRKLFRKEPKILAEAIKPKTIIYSPFIKKLLDNKVKIHYASHITGHGWRKVMRAKKEFTYIIEAIPEPQAIFQKIQQKTRMTDEQIYGDYNMGAGFALFVSEESVDQVIKVAKQFKIQALDAGYVKRGPRKVAIEPLNIEFKGASLQIR